MPSSRTPASTDARVTHSAASPRAAQPAKASPVKVAALPTQRVGEVLVLPLEPLDDLADLDELQDLDASIVALPGAPTSPAPATAKSRAPRRRGRAARPVVPVALGSLTQPGARTGDLCERCGTSRVTSLALLLTDGTPVRFTSCHSCEHRSWVGPEGSLDRATVLERTRKER